MHLPTAASAVRAEICAERMSFDPNGLNIDPEGVGVGRMGFLGVVLPADLRRARDRMGSGLPTPFDGARDTRPATFCL
jgi:hypothetical protein